MEVESERRHYESATDDACRLTVAIQGSSPAAGPSAIIAAGRLSRGRVTAARRDENGSARAAEVVRRCDAGARAAGCDTSGDSGPEMHPPGQQGGAKSGAAARGSGLRGAGAARAMR
jgi:hypothetical protein